jgi:hypothetical protein
MITQTQAIELFSYDPETGKLYRREPWREVGTPNQDGHLTVNINGKGELVHRIVWVLMAGILNDNDIDHINGNNQDNRFSNLRQCTRSENLCNSKKPSNNTSGFKGVTLEKSGYWMGYVKFKGKRHSKSGFLNAETANRWVKAKRVELHGEFARHE